MLKLAMLATALLVVASTAAVEGAVFEAASEPAVASPCHPGPAALPACALRTVDSDGDGAVSTAELANLVVPTPAADWTPLRLEQGADLDFKDAAAQGSPMLPILLDRERPQPLIPALFAIGALVVLLRKRPT